MNQKTKGYLLVASRDPIYYSWACNLMGGIKDFYPEAKVCLVTEERFVDARAQEADHLIFCDNHPRAKMWGMYQTPWDLTFYIDADMEVLHEDIAKVFDEIEDRDMVFTGLPRELWHIFMDTEFPGGTFELCGACCLYRKSELTMEFIKDWYEIYVQQQAGNWWPTKEDGTFDTYLYPHHLKQWDQFTLWWLTNKEEKYKDLKYGLFKDNLKWNYWGSLMSDPNHPMKDDTVLLHMSSRATRKLEDIAL